MSADNESRTVGASRMDEENINFNKSDNPPSVKIYPMMSRLSLNEVELKAIEKMNKWVPYESASFEQPCCFTCCSSCFFQIRYFCQTCFRILLPLTSISLGKFLFFLLFAAIAAVLGYAVWDDLSSSGLLACLFLGLTFAFPTRNSVWLALTGIPFERVLFWHKYVAIISVAMGIYHGICAQDISLTGIILVALMAALVIFAFYPIRRKAFECFYRMHWVLSVLVVVFALIHGAAIAMIGAILWILDVLIRVIVVRRNKKRIEMAEITQIPQSLVKICFQNNNFHYKAGQYVFLCVPALSIWEWHPFSLSSSPNEKVVSLHARVLGDWTTRLYDLSKHPESVTQIWVDGPYGNCALNLDNNEYKIFILVSGGIGITPMQSICNQLIYEHLRGRELTKIYFIWTVKDKFMVDEITESPSAFYVKKLPAKLPYAFQPDVLVKHEMGHILESFFHLSTVRNEADFVKANINPRTQKLLKFGRPNLPEYFEKIKKVAVEQHINKVAVLSCGPEMMMEECQKLAKRHSKGGVQFDYHGETFNF